MIGMFCFVLVFIVTACSNNTASSKVKNNNNNSLKLYYTESDFSTWTNAIIKFKSDYPNINVDITLISNRDEYKTRINAELVDGVSYEFLLFSINV